MNEKNSISSYNGYQPLIGAFGANGSIPGVEALPLDIPEGLDEKTVAAIVVGASLSPDRLTYPMGDFASGSDVTVSNQSLIMDQVSSGNVTPQTAAILSAGRKDAQAALDAFKAGDDSLVKRHLKTYADHAVRKVGDLGQIAADRAQHNYILDSYKNAQQKDPNKPFTKMLPPEFAVESGKISAAGTALGNDKNSPLALGTDSIKQGARDLEERRDFKLMISKIKT